MPSPGCQWHPKVKAPSKKIVFGQPSWRLASSSVEAFLTETGGHLGPVTFKLGRRALQPYSVAPWAGERLDPATPNILKALRGDFFCLPFGGNDTPFRGERHPAHGETANARWRFDSLEKQNGLAVFRASLQTKVRPGAVQKEISLADGQPVIYSRHIISGMTGPMNLGHHAMLKFPDSPASGLLSTSPFVYAQVLPAVFESPEKRGYSFLQPGAEFNSLDSVPAANGQTADLSRYPARRGYEDLVLLVSDASLPFAWTAVAFPKERFVWFALKDPRVLRETVFWISNGGRHYPPWNSRHVNVLGLEEVTSYFHLGLAESARKNPLTEKGFPAALQLSPRKPLAVSYIAGVAEIPAGFDHIASITADPGGQAITLHSRNRKRATASVNLSFLQPVTP